MVSSVLLVDDDPAFLILAARIFDSVGIEVVATAPDAAAAVTAAETTRPESALVDVGLPDRNGIDLAYELAALPWEPRVVVTSTDRDAASVIAARDGARKLPFVPKEELAAGPLLRLLAAE
ncbi:MAG: response regulator [Thermoleophilaceae bacterium]